MSGVTLKDIAKRFGGFTAVHRMSLDIPDGGFVTLLGPSGCGKTTTLRMVAGLLDPSEGEIAIGGRRVNDLPIHKRNLGIVFQNYALFPHKTVAENVGFGLRYRDVSRDEAARRVKDALELVQLPQLGDRYPKELSGGQQQRIALARAIVIEPDVLLLDEPLSALDANLREDMRVELKRIQDRIGVTTIFVTHDQSEALAMSDHIVVMSAGRVEQVGPPSEVYNTPASEFVARFLGASNILAGGRHGTRRWRGDARRAGVRAHGHSGREGAQRGRRGPGQAGDPGREAVADAAGRGARRQRVRGRRGGDGRLSGSGRALFRAGGRDAVPGDQHDRRAPLRRGRGGGPVPAPPRLRGAAGGVLMRGMRTARRAAPWGGLRAPVRGRTRGFDAPSGGSPLGRPAVCAIAWRRNRGGCA